MLAVEKDGDVELALPRAAGACPGQPASVCWGWAFDEREVRDAADAVRTAARA